MKKHFRDLSRVLDISTLVNASKDILAYHGEY